MTVLRTFLNDWLVSHLCNYSCQFYLYLPWFIGYLSSNCNCNLKLPLDTGFLNRPFVPFQFGLTISTIGSSETTPSVYSSEAVHRYPFCKRDGNSISDQRPEILSKSNSLYFLGVSILFCTDCIVLLVTIAKLEFCGTTSTDSPSWLD